MDRAGLDPRRLLGGFALCPLPGTDFDYARVGVPAGWPYHPPARGHWNKNSNLAWAFDTWFFNLFPANALRGQWRRLCDAELHPDAGHHDPGPSGRRHPPPARVRLGEGALARRRGRDRSGAGWGLGELGVCPVVKRIWTPSWVLYSGGWCFLFLAGFYAVLDLLGLRFWAFPLG